MALKAPSEFAALMNVEETNIQVTEGPSSLSPVKFVIDTQNRFLLQMAEVWTRGWLSEYLCRRSLLLMIFCTLQQNLFPEPCPDRKEYPPVAEFAERGKGEGDENFAKI